MSKRIRKWNINSTDNGFYINEEGVNEAQWPLQGKETWTLAQINPNLESLAEENFSVASMEWYARMMAAAPMMRHLLEKCDKDGWDIKWSNRLHELLKSIDNGYDQSEMEEVEDA